MSGQRVVLVGATGMVGGHVLGFALSDPQVAAVTSVGRRVTGTSHPKLREILHDDFSDCGPIEDQLARHDAAVFCLGAYTGSVQDAEFRRITVDYPLGFARSLFASSPGAAFCLLSGQGADQSGKSRIAFARYKGEAEKALLEIGFPRVHLFRPGYIYPVTPRAEPNRSYRIMRALYPAIRRIYRNIGLSSVDLARAMLTVALHGTPNDPPILENRAIRTLPTH